MVRDDHTHRKGSIAEETTTPRLGELALSPLWQSVCRHGLRNHRERGAKPFQILSFFLTPTNAPKTMVLKHFRSMLKRMQRAQKIWGFFPCFLVDQLRFQHWLIGNGMEIRRIIRAHFYVKQQPEIFIEFTQIREKSNLALSHPEISRSYWEGRSSQPVRFGEIEEGHNVI